MRAALEIFAWGGAVGYVIAHVETAVRDIRKAKREAAAKVAAARQRRVSG